MILEINNEEIQKIEDSLIFNLDASLCDGDFEYFKEGAGDILSKKEFDEEVEMTRLLLKKVKKLNPTEVKT